MRDQQDESLSEAAADDTGEFTYGVQARPQRSRAGNKSVKPPRSKRIKRSGPIGGLHQRRNKRINW